MRVIKPIPAIRTLIPEIATATGRSVDWIYERQRDLVACGVLKALPGRGPGSGVPASPKNLALLLMALAIWDRGVPDTEMQKLSGAKCDAGYSIITPGARFADVLEAILELPNDEDRRANLPVRPNEIHFYRDTLSAVIFWPGVKSDQPMLHRFTQARPAATAGLRSVSILTRAVFEKIDHALRTAI